VNQVVDSWAVQSISNVRREKIRRLFKLARRYLLA
jgi:hypothetical protein